VSETARNKPRYGVRHVSVFTLASGLVYLAISVQALPTIAKNIRLSMIFQGSHQVVELPYVWVAILTFNFLIALRLYVHAWAMDELPILRLSLEQRTPAGRPKLIAEWLLRTLWITLTTYLPTRYEHMAGRRDAIIGGPIEQIYTVIFVAVVVWDFLMFEYVTQSAKTGVAIPTLDAESKTAAARSLRWHWVGYDLLLLLTVGMLCGFASRWTGAWENWKVPVYLLAMSIGGSLSIVQLFMWIPEVLRERA
jgi:hypothetical protein